MKRKITKFLAALALLVFTMPSLVAWGQTKTEGFEAATASSTYNSTYTLNSTNSDCGIGWSIYYGCVSTNNKISGTKSAQMRWYSSATSNLPYMKTTTPVDNLTNVAFKAKVGNTNVKMDVKYSSDGTEWDVLAAAVTFQNTNAAEFSYTIPSGGKYIQIGVSSSSTAPNSGNYAFIVDDVVFTYSTGTTPTISFNPLSIDLGDVNLVGEEITETFTVSQANLDDDITLSVDNGSLNITSIEQDAEPTTVTWTYTPTSAGPISATVTATSGETAETLEITGTAFAPVSGYSIDFENEASLYSDWTFTTLTSKQTGNSYVTAHGGTYYGITGNGGSTGTATAAIATKTAVPTPYTLTCFVTRQSDNTNSSTWYVQVSANGEDWTDVESTSATDMAKGVWKEISVDLSAYTDVYVRVYYDGSTAVRNIDDLTLSTDAPAVLVPTFSPVAGTYTEIQNVTITCATEGATIYYTTDGTTPTNDSEEYTEAITVSETTTIKAIAYVGTESSAVATAEYVINLPSAATPTFTPAAGTYTETQTVTIACETQGASILYKLTENGEWQAYTTALTISETTTVWAKATKTGLNDSEVATATYTIVTPITIAAVREQPTGDVVTTGIITYISGKNAYIQDATAAICVFVNTSNYWTNNSYAVGDEILVSGTLDTYGTGNLLEITSPTVTKLSTSNDLPYASKTIAEINEDNFSDLQCLHVKIENATVQSVSGSNNTIAQGENTILVYSSSMGVSEGDVITSFYANVGYYNGLQLVNPTEVEIQVNTNPTITVTPATVTLDAGFHEVCTLAISYENYGELEPNLAVIECDADGEQEDYDWLSASIVENTVQYGVLPNEGGARTAYLKVYDTEIEGVEFIVTINQEAYVAPFEGGTYQLATSIESGSTYIITSELLVDEVYAMGADRGNNRGSVSVSIDETTVTVEPDQEVYEFVITSLDDPQGFYSIYDPRNAGYLYAAGGTSSNYLKTKADLDNKGQWTITFGDYNEASIVANFGNEKAGDPRNTMRFNSTNNPPIFSCYASGGQSDVYLYKKVETTPAGYTYSVNGYGSNDGGYVLIATPTVANADPATVGMITDKLGSEATPATSTYDLYYYDQTEDLEWRNYRAQSFELVPGKGYLYASKDGVALTFTGELNPSFTDVTLPYTEGDFTKSIYLAGNSSTEAQTFYVYDFDNDLELQTVNFLTINGTGDGFTTATATSLTAQPMQGFFVQAAGSNWILSTEDLSDGTNSNQGVSLLNINVLRDRGNVIDNAIVSFSEGSMMNKFYLRDNTTRVYIPQGNEEMAVVRSTAEGEMPVSFKAAENGTYTLAIETENVEMNYLHLIDNMTGMDVDLLQTPSYTFEAKTNDYTSRFRLVFKASSTSSEADETFAYYDGSNWTVSNLGEATLQVVDVTGRTVSSETINGNATISLNQTPGVYMLRLVNGNSVKVQKVVVR